MKKYCIIGDDLRSTYIRKMYIDEGKNITNFKEADYVIAPIPFTRDGIRITGEMLECEELIESLENKILFTGAIQDNIRNKMKNIKFYDLMDLDEIAILNAIPTVEGAIFEAIKNSHITLSGANVLVLGYGRIGKVLCETLRGMNAKVYCEARKSKDIAFIDAMGYNSIHIDDLNSYLPKMDYIFNTIPVTILNKDNLKYINKECTIIDLASVPGGIDFEFAKKLDLNVVWALSLPSKVAPKSAAIYLKEKIDEIITKENSIDT